MIPDIALIVACYVNTRFFQMILSKGENASHVFVKVLAGLSIAIVCFCMIDILNTGSRSMPSLP